MQHQIAKPLTINCSPTELNRYLVDSRAGILAILATLQKACSLVTAYFSGGNNFMLTSIVAVRPDENVVILDYRADSAVTQRVTHERIKMQFYTTSFRQVRFEGRDAFSMPLPVALLRLQRREYFRISTPLTRPPKCVIVPQAPAVPAPLEVNIKDMSCGGIGLIAPGSLSGIKTDSSFQSCSIQLAEIGTVEVNLYVRSIANVALKNGAVHLHLGCEFVDMPERERAKIQRYINNMERERKNRIGGR